MAIDLDPRQINGVAYLTLRQASFTYDLNEQWLRRMCREETMPFIRDEDSPRKPILIAVSDLEAYVANKGQKRAGTGEYKGLPSYVQKAKSARKAIREMQIVDAELDEEDREIAVAWMDVYVAQQVARSIAANAAKEAEAAGEAVTAGEPEAVADDDNFEEEWAAELDGEDDE